MKTQNNFSFETVLTAIFLLALLATPACSGTPGHLKEKRLQGEAATEHPADPPEIDIYTAALFGDLKAINQHIAAGTDLNSKDDYGSTPLIIAATFGKTEVAKVLIEAGADLNITNNDGATALHPAAFLCRTEIVEALLERGIDKNIENKYGSTALESVSVPFESVKPIYDQFSKDLGPLGLKLNYDQIKKTRPVIADLLK